MLAYTNDTQYVNYAVCGETLREYCNANIFLQDARINILLLQAKKEYILFNHKVSSHTHIIL